MKNNTIKFEYVTRLAGTKNEYYILKIYKEGERWPLVHNSKDLSYLKKIERDFRKGTR